jgi:hypothetical protein
MNSQRLHLVATATLMLGALGGYRAWKSEQKNDQLIATTESISAGQRRDRGDIPTAIDKLRSIRDMDVSKAPRFETLEIWAEDLTDNDLLQLLRESQSDTHAGLTGWLRCALYAEWGRRDPRAALDDLLKHPELAGTCGNQAVFSILRGWSEVDPDAAMAEARRMISPFSDYEGHGPDRIIETIWFQLANRDPEGILARIANNQDSLLDSPEMGGVFRGFRNRSDLDLALQKWTEHVWNDPATKQAIAAHLSTSTQPNSNSRVIALDVALDAALALAAHDFDAAASWLKDNPLGSEVDDAGRMERFNILWAHSHPREALARLRSNPHSEFAQKYAIAVLCKDPAQGPKVMPHLDTAERRFEAISIAASDLNTYTNRDFFPVPGQTNRLLDYEGSYRSLLETIDAARLPDDQRIKLLKTVHQTFMSEVPAAAEAAMDDSP